MALSHAIMTALLEDQLSGYELTKSFDTSLGFFWKASHQQIYKCLRDMEQQGLLRSEHVAQDGRPDKIVYELTTSGHATLEQWVLGESKFRESKDDLYVKLYNLAPANVAHMRNELQQRADATRQRLDLYQRIQARHYAEPAALALRKRGVALVLMAGIAQCEQYLEWFSQCTTLLRQED